MYHLMSETGYDTPVVQVSVNSFCPLAIMLLFLVMFVYNDLTVNKIQLILPTC